MIAKIFTKRIHVMPVGDKWGIFEFNNMFQSFFYDLSHFGIKVAVGNFFYLLRGKNEIR